MEFKAPEEFVFNNPHNHNLEKNTVLFLFDQSEDTDENNDKIIVAKYRTDSHRITVRFKDGMKHGILYHEKKDKNNKMVACELSNYQKDQMHGLSIVYDYSLSISKKPFSITSCMLNYMTNPEEYEEDDCETVRITHYYIYENGVVHGNYRRYAQSKLIYEGNYINGKKEGLFYAHEIEKIEYFKDDHLAKIYNLKTGEIKKYSYIEPEPDSPLSLDEAKKTPGEILKIHYKKRDEQERKNKERLKKMGYENETERINIFFESYIKMPLSHPDNTK